jgi:SAM-dependent methyltransferase
MTKGVGQDPISVNDNAAFFDANERYARLVGSLDTYRAIRLVLNRELKGVRRLLDVGNGGVFDYDLGLVEQVVAVDLFLDGAGAGKHGHVTFRFGDALALEEPDADYDLVLQNQLFHHLVGTDVDSTMANIHQAVREAHRVLESDGRLVVIESCVPASAFAIERRLFGGLRWLAQTPLMSHPATLQFPPETIAELIRDRFGNVTVTQIPLGRWVLHFGLRWPAVLTPARLYRFTAVRA